MILTVSILFSGAFIPDIHADSQSVTVSAGQQQLFQLTNVNSGYKITGSFQVTGGSGNDIKFWITDPEGNTILNLGTVSKGTSFDFTASKSGIYILHFDNSFSLISSKVVSLTYNLDTASAITYNIPGYPLEAVFLGLLLLTTILYRCEES
jgi:hypothetical protein